MTADVADARRELAQAIAVRTAHEFYRHIPDDVPALPVLLRAIERAVGYFDHAATEILELAAQPEGVEGWRQLEGLLGAVGQLLGASLAIAEMMPTQALEALAGAQLKPVNPNARQ